MSFFLGHASKNFFSISATFLGGGMVNFIWEVGAWNFGKFEF